MANMIDMMFFTFLVLVTFWGGVRFMPTIIYLVKRLNFLDKPNERKLHTIPKASMGGLGIVGTMLAVLIPLLIFDQFDDFYFVILSLVLFTIIGFIDDWKNMPAKIKLLLQILFATVAYYLGFKIDYGFGFLGINEIHPILSYILTLGVHVLLVNAYNLIDGIDGLAGGILLLNLSAFAMIFMFYGHYYYSLISFVTLGSVAGFLKYNLFPSKIFMGDTGSLPLGALMSILTFKVLHFVNQDPYMEDSIWLITFVIALNGIPLFDSLRVFVIRMLKGKSPFSADRNHIHHLYIKNGFGHLNGAFVIHALHLSVLILTIFIARQLSISQGVFYVLFVLFLAFELNTIFRLQNKDSQKEVLNKQKDKAMKSNRFLKTIDKKIKYEKV